MAPETNAHRSTPGEQHLIVNTSLAGRNGWGELLGSAEQWVWEPLLRGGSPACSIRGLKLQYC